MIYLYPFLRKSNYQNISQPIQLISQEYQNEITSHQWFFHLQTKEIPIYFIQMRQYLHDKDLGTYAIDPKSRFEGTLKIQYQNYEKEKRDRIFEWFSSKEIPELHFHQIIHREILERDILFHFHEKFQIDGQIDVDAIEYWVCFYTLNPSLLQSCLKQQYHTILESDRLCIIFQLPIEREFEFKFDFDFEENEPLIHRMKIEIHSIWGEIPSRNNTIPIQSLSVCPSILQELPKEVPDFLWTFIIYCRNPVSLRECIDHIEDLEGRKEIIVCDDASYIPLRYEYSEIRLLESRRYRGRAWFYQYGICESKGRYICLCEETVRFRRNFVEEMNRFYGTREDIFVYTNTGPYQFDFIREGCIPDVFTFPKKLFMESPFEFRKFQTTKAITFDFLLRSKVKPIYCWTTEYYEKREDTYEIQLIILEYVYREMGKLEFRLEWGVDDPPVHAICGKNWWGALQVKYQTKWISLRVNEDFLRKNMNSKMEFMQIGWHQGWIGVNQSFNVLLLGHPMYLWDTIVFWGDGEICDLSDWGVPCERWVKNKEYRGNVLMIRGGIQITKPLEFFARAMMKVAPDWKCLIWEGGNGEWWSSGVEVKEPRMIGTRDGKLDWKTKRDVWFLGKQCFREV